MGQKAAVRMFKHKSEALNALEKKELVEFTSNFLQNNVIKAQDFEDSLVAFFKQQTNANEAKIKSRTIFEKIVSLFSEGNGYERTFNKYIKNLSDENPVIVYLKGQGKIVNQVLSNDITNDKYLRFCRKSTKKLGNELIARKETALKILKDKNINKSIIATIGGLIALAIFAKPIDYFVENILMEKLINPALDRVTKSKNPKANKEEKIDLAV